MPYLQQVLFGAPRYTSYLSREYGRLQAFLETCGVGNHMLARSWWSQYWLGRKHGEAGPEAQGLEDAGMVERDFLSSTQGIAAIVAMVHNESKKWGVALSEALQFRCVAVLGALLTKVHIPWADGEFE